MERGGVIFLSQEQLREMCCIDHKLEHLLRGSRVLGTYFALAERLQSFASSAEMTQKFEWSY